jgi:hypothetical protein
VSPLLLAVLIVLGILALLVARGMWLLGQGTDVEQQARARAGGDVTRAGWSLLDMAREADLPFVSAIEDRLGINQDDEGDGP